MATEYVAAMSHRVQTERRFEIMNGHVNILHFLVDLFAELKIHILVL